MLIHNFFNKIESVINTYISKKKKRNQMSREYALYGFASKDTTTMTS